MSGLVRPTECSTTIDITIASGDPAPHCALAPRGGEGEAGERSTSLYCSSQGARWSLHLNMKAPRNLKPSSIVLNCMQQLQWNQKRRNPGNQIETSS